jgi:hypothetical protein
MTGGLGLPYSGDSAAVPLDVTGVVFSRLPPSRKATPVASLVDSSSAVMGRGGARRPSGSQQQLVKVRRHTRTHRAVEQRDGEGRVMAGRRGAGPHPSFGRGVPHARVHVSMITSPVPMGLGSHDHHRSSCARLEADYFVLRVPSESQGGQLPASTI